MNSLPAGSGGNPGSVWIIGLSASGKSTLSRLLVKKLRENGYPCLLLDGDEVRAIFHDRLGYDPEARREQTQRIVRLTRWASSQGILPVVAVIHPFEADRRKCRETLPGYFEVHLDCDVSVCAQRDTKNIYRPAFEGRAANVVGVDIPYDKPEHPDLVLKSAGTPPEDMRDALWERLAREVLPRYRACLVESKI